MPTHDNPLPDAISGATPIDNFKLQTSISNIKEFIVKLEINVAFDDNEYYSEFDFAEDEVYHNGTGLLGQPSLVYRTFIDVSDYNKYTLMKIDGHGHHSGKNGDIYKDLTKLSSALEIVKYIIVRNRK